MRDLPAGDRTVALVWVKRIWRCVHRECEKQTWTETHPQIAPRAVVDYGTGLVEHVDRSATVSAIGVDETVFLRAGPTRSTVFATGIVDLHPAS